MLRLGLWITLLLVVMICQFSPNLAFARNRVPTSRLSSVSTKTFTLPKRAFQLRDSSIFKLNCVSDSSAPPASISKKRPNAKDMFMKYGVVYLATSIFLSIISYSLCYTLVSNGVDVASLLAKVGIKGTSVASGAGTAAIAYAMHKAASPIRFPPTVFLTHVIATWIGRSDDAEKSEEGLTKK